MLVLHRMERMIDVMYGVIAANKKLNMDSWMDIVDDEVEDQKLRRGEPCNTVCCAAGYGALDSLLQGEGLHMVGLSNGDLIGKIFTTKDYNKHLRNGLMRVEIAYEGHSDFVALSAFFGITLYAAGYLFDPSTYEESVSPDAVIARMREVIKLDGRCPDDLDEDVQEPLVQDQSIEIGPYTPQ